MLRRFPTALRRYRWKELGLFLVPFLILLLGMTQLLLAQKVPGSTFSTKSLPLIQDLAPALGVIVCLLAVNLLFSFFFPKTDQVLLPLVGLLSGIGVLMATRLGPTIEVGDPTLGTRQLAWVLIGLFVCVVTLFGLRNMNWLRRYKYSWAFLSILVLLPSLIAGIKSFRSGAPTHDTLNVGPLSLQPSELLKIAIIIFFAAYISENFDVLAQGAQRLGLLRLPPLRLLGPLVLMLGFSLVIFLVVRELGLAILIYGLFLTMLYLGSGKFSYIIWNLVIFAVLAFVIYILFGKLFGYVEQRFAVVTFDVVNWQNWTGAQQNFAENAGFQIVQGLITLSSGGILGTGLGLGHAGAFVPIVQSDMVFTALGEEIGLAGLFAIIGVYLLIIYRGYRIAIEASDPFNQLLAAGLTSIFALQTLIIAFGNMKFLPLTGIPLPFLSYGGSSIIANYIIIGILLRISHNTAREREGFA